MLEGLGGPLDLRLPSIEFPGLILDAETPVLEGLDLGDPFGLGAAHLLQLVLDRTDQLEYLVRANW